MSDDGFLSPEQRLTLASVLDEIIPPSADGRLPGAGELGVADALAQREELRSVVDAGLASLEEIARSRGADFARLASDSRRWALDAVAARAPLFLPTLVGYAYITYYQDARVREILGLERRPPFPRGYEMEATDFAILDPVRRRDPIYREP